MNKEPSQGLRYLGLSEKAQIEVPEARLYSDR